MTIHGDDVVRTIRKDLAESNIAPSQTPLRHTPIEDGRGYPNRDGRYEFDAVGRDFVRGFRITVAAISVEDVVGELGEALNPDGSFPVEP